MHQRLPYIDTVKGLSILLLVGFHICGQIFHSEPRWFRVLSYQGVPAFFLASGFTLANSLMGRNTTSSLGNWAKWLARRLWRIVPLYWIVLLITLGVYAAGVPVLRITPANDAAMTDFALHAMMLHIFFKAEYYSINVAWWFTGAIFYFYLVFPALYCALKRRKTGTAVFLIVVVAVFALNALTGSSQIPFSFLFFATGVYLRTVSRNPLDLSLHYLIIVFLTGASTCAALLYVLVTPWSMTPWLHTYAYALFTLSFVVSAYSLSEIIHKMSPLFGLLKLALMWYGRQSYAMFLIHWGFIFPVISRFTNKTLGIIVYLALVTMASLLLTVIDEKKSWLLKGVLTGSDETLSGAKEGLTRD